MTNHDKTRISVDVDRAFRDRLEEARFVKRLPSFSEAARIALAEWADSVLGPEEPKEVPHAA